MTKKIELPLLLLAIAAFLAPLIGGQISVDAVSMTPGGSNILLALIGQPEAPTLSHGILSLLCSGALMIMLWQRKIMQVPNNTVSTLFLILFGVLCASVGYSDFKSASIPAALEWLTYGFAFYAVVASVGRQKGPVTIMAAIFAGCIVLALLGIREYGNMKAIDPTWRIFPQWVGPNALAAILVIGLFLGIGLSITADRMLTLVSGIGCVAIGTALFLTQSKGGLLALAFSSAVLVILLLIWLPKKNWGKSLGTMSAILVVVGLLAVAISFKPGTPAGPQGTGSPLGRIANASTSADQSMGFRKLLWESAVKLIKRSPIGSGINTFQYESSRPGLVTQTRLAHETYLQLVVEASPIALFALLGGVGMWGYLVSKGARQLAPGQNILRASIVAAICAVLFHGLIDSDFSYYGVGLTVFMLFGVGLLLSTDAVAPEFMPTALRRGSMAGIGLVSLLLIYLGVVESSRAEVRGLLGSGRLNEAQASLESLRSMASWDADVFGLSALSTRSLPERLAYAKRAVELAPSTHNYRTLARIQADAGQPNEARDSLKRTIQIDPNNMAAMTLLTDIELKEGLDDEAKKTLNSLIEIEQTQYFKVRSLPELVATDTYHARVRLAQLDSDPKHQIDLLQPAIDGYKEYADKTIPNVIRYAKDPSGGMDYGGESVAKAKDKITEAQVAAKQLADLYRTTGAAKLAEEASAAVELFSKTLESLSFK